MIKLAQNTKSATAQHLLQMADYYLTQLSLPFHKRDVRVRKETLKKYYNENLEKLAKDYVIN